MTPKPTAGLRFVATLLVLLFVSCVVKRGCPATQSGLGAERLLSGDKVKKQKFKIKGMN